MLFIGYFELAGAVIVGIIYFGYFFLMYLVSKLKQFTNWLKHLMPTFKAQVHEEIEQKDTPAKSKSKNKNKQLTKV